MFYRVFALSLALIPSIAQAWTPTAGPQITRYPECLAADLEQSILDQGGDTLREQTVIRGFFAECADKLNASSTADKNLLFQAETHGQIVSTEYKGAAKFKHELITLKSGAVLPALIGVQAGKTRPLVIWQAGFQSDLDSHMLYEAMINMTEEGPFHLIILGSSSSEESERANQAYLIGGQYEGSRILELVSALRSEASPLKSMLDPKLISSVHVVGTSLGGHGALFAGLYSSLNPDANGEMPIRSVIAECPVVDLEAAFSDLVIERRSWLISRYFLKKFWQQQESLRAAVPALAALIDSHPKGEALASAVANMTSGFLQSHPVALREADGADFWSINNYPAHVERVRVPTFIWAAENDSVVSQERNALKARDLNPEVSTMITAKGAHCFYGETFGWNLNSTLLRTLLVAHSPELLAKRQVHHVKLDGISFSSRFHTHLDQQERISFEWKALRGKTDVVLSTNIFDPSMTFDCEHSEKSCTYTENVTIPGKLLGITQAPATVEEAERLTRYLNANVRISGAQQGVIGKRENPAQLDYVTYE